MLRKAEIPNVGCSTWLESVEGFAAIVEVRTLNVDSALGIWSESRPKYFPSLFSIGSAPLLQPARHKEYFVGRPCVIKPEALVDPELCVWVSDRPSKPLGLASTLPKRL
jgi:hypothetical protein